MHTRLEARFADMYTQRRSNATTFYSPPILSDAISSEVPNSPPESHLEIKTLPNCPDSESLERARRGLRVGNMDTSTLSNCLSLDAIPDIVDPHSHPTSAHHSSLGRARRVQGDNSDGSLRAMPSLLSCAHPIPLNGVTHYPMFFQRPRSDAAKSRILPPMCQSISSGV
ncbi:hypothetical protein BC628DRAFT_1399545 [Trametes gibbosa]|nr:hypothetical protein BC628DRAFT_1399545 [Trametes gibbosa]